jgi:hypothetical protein
MNTSEEATGTELGLQLAATLQEPPLVLVHAMLAAWAGKVNADASKLSASTVARTCERRTQSDKKLKQLLLRKALFLEEWVLFFMFGSYQFDF